MSLALLNPRGGGVRTDDTLYSGDNKVYKGVCGVARLHKYGGSIKNCVNGLEASCFHSFTGFLMAKKETVSDG